MLTNLEVQEPEPQLAKEEKKVAEVGFEPTSGGL
jgi:hypothetical protein